MNGEDTFSRPRPHGRGYDVATLANQLGARFARHTSRLDPSHPREPLMNGEDTSSRPRPHGRGYVVDGLGRPSYGLEQNRVGTKHAQTIEAIVARFVVEAEHFDERPTRDLSEITQSYAVNELALRLFHGDLWYP